MNAPQKPGWLARILLSITTLALVVVGFFFLTAALIVGALIALVFGVRLWWTLRKLKRAGVNPNSYGMDRDGDGHRSGALDGEYEVVERESTAQKLPPNPNNTPPAP